MATNLENIYFQQVTDPTNGSINTINVATNQRNKFSSRSANFLIVLNKSDQLLFARLNNSDNQKFPLDSVNGELVIDRHDLIRFSSLEIINDSGSNATGTVHVTYGWLYKDIIGVDLDV